MDAELTVTQAAEILGVSRQRVDELIRAGRLAFREIGPIRLLPRSAVMRFRRKKAGRPKKSA